jgi:uncharacterized protein YndB with AHSA1/START domain
MRVMLVAVVTSAALLAKAGGAAAEVKDSSAAGFQVHHVRTVTATPARVWTAFLRIGSWWSKEHTFSGNAANLRLEPRAGGCFCETLPRAGSVSHLTVVYVDPARRIGLAGALGPLAPGGLAGGMTVEFTPKGETTEIALTYNVGGYFPGGLANIAAPVDQVLGAQMDRLQRLVETGSAEPVAK